jgi:predicted anti-sigma-YlaC factor YlaD
MRDCDDVAMRDRLPELLLEGEAASSGRLGPVRAHVEVCAACRAELAMLARVRSIAATPEINVARLAAHIRPYRATSQWRRMAGSTAFRIAASVVLVIGLGTVVPRGLDRSAPDSASGRTNATPSEMALGTPLGDLDEEDLQALLSTLGELDAVTSTEADMVVLPALDRNGA